MTTGAQVSDATIGWIISGIVGFAALIGGIIARDRQVANQIKTGDDALHSRINDIRDQYVKSSDLDKHLSRLDASVRDLRDDMKEQNKSLLNDMKEHNTATNSRLDQLLVALGSRHDT